MLLVSGMMGVKRQCLGTLRSRRESRIPAHLATVTELPVSAMDDPNPFVPPSQYEVGDALVRVNHEQLNLLNHENVVRVLRGLLRTTGSQVLLLRFAYAEDSPRLLRATTSPPPPPPLPPKTPGPRPSTMENPQSEPRVSQSDLDTEEAFRSESWHGSRKPPRARKGQGQGREMARSVSPHRRTGPALLRSQSLGEGGPPAVAGLAHKGSGAEAGDKEGEREGWAVDGMRPRGKRRGVLWGEPEMGLAGGDGGSRHIYLGDMGHARVQRTLQAIAEDVQVGCGRGVTFSGNITITKEDGPLGDSTAVVEGDVFKCLQ
ncbi:unnamed protein product [Ectocarpus sp. CCAP 1310/34]|nr:unnamed protein product [Ectocarpus sp. CCAP 1310/34]